MRLKLLFLIIAGLFLVQAVSAEIMLSQPSTIYNLGDKIEIKATIKPSQYSSSFFEMNLICNKDEKNFYKTPLALNKNEEKQISSSLVLTKSFLGGLTGECNITARFSGETARTQNFEISDRIDVLLSIENISVDTGKEIEIKGSSLKKNGQKVEGFVKITIENTSIDITRTVTNGEFVSSFTFPEETKAGNYVLNARVYEKSDGEETNAGDAKIIMNIKRKPSKIEIATLKQNINPGETLSFTSIVYDQADEKIEADISVKVYTPGNSVFIQKIFKSGEGQEVLIETNQKPGYWRIEASALGLEAKKLFYVEELEKAKFEIADDILTVTNVGNVPYRKSVQIVIGDVTEIENLNLEVGEFKKFRFSAPPGAYDVKISDGAEELANNGVSLTGKAIGLSEIGGNMSFIKQYPVVWIFLIAVLGLFITVLVQRVVKKKFYASPIFSEKPNRAEIFENKKKEISLPLASQVKIAEHSLVLHGKKENTGILAIKIQNLESARKEAGETINSISEAIISSKGTIYETSDFLIGIFSSPTTKTFSNEIIATKVSRKIEEILKDSNRKKKYKIDYGIALNSGELILNKEKDRLKFTSIGNAINLGKRIAKMAENEILLSEDIQKRLLNDVKTEKEVREGINVYHIKIISEKDRYSGFIQGFLDRQNKQSC